MNDHEDTPRWLSPWVVTGSLLAAVAIGLMQPLTSADPRFQGSFWWNTLPTIFGYFAGLILFPAVLVGLVAAIAWIIRRPLDRHTAAKFFFWTWLPFTLLAGLSALGLSDTDPAGEEPYTFSPDGAPYVVTFAGQAREYRKRIVTS